jgi:hypothetical protein
MRYISLAAATMVISDFAVGQTGQTVLIIPPKCGTAREKGNGEAAAAVGRREGVIGGDCGLADDKAAAVLVCENLGLFEYPLSSGLLLIVSKPNRLEIARYSSVPALVC